jgi:hypothetical protein
MMPRWIIVVIAVLTIWALNRPLQAEQTYTGVVEMVDDSIMRITIKTDSGQTESFSVTNPQILKKLAKNDRVSVAVGNDGMVNQITKLSGPQQNAPPKPADR